MHAGRLFCSEANVRFLKLRKTTKNYKTVKSEPKSSAKTQHAIRQPMQTRQTPRRPSVWLAWRLALWLTTVLWAPDALAAPSQIVAQAFVLDPSGQMTLEQVQKQPETAYTGPLLRLQDRSVVWVRLRVAPSAGSPHPAPESLRAVALWSHSLSLYDPFRRDASAGLARLDSPPTVSLFTVQTLPVAFGTQPRDLWLRLESRGPIYLKTAVLTFEQAASREVLDGILLGMVTGAQVLLILLGAFVWLADRRGIGHTLFTKQVANLTLTVLNANLFVLPELHGREAIMVYGLQGLRLLNAAVSLWFFMRVLKLLGASTWALKLQRVPFALLLVCLLLLLSDQLAWSRTLLLALYLTVPLGLVAASLTCLREPLEPVTGLGLVRRAAERLAFGLMLWAAWLVSFISGHHRTQDISFTWVMGPIAALSAVGVLLVVSWQRLRADQHRQAEARQRAELDALALDFERNERQRQQEFMAMLTHELKAPLSTLGIVIGSPTPSASMRRHADLALASMRQVIDHCAQSADIDDAGSPLQQVACELAVELELRVAAQADHARIRIERTNAVPFILADRRMLSVIFNNLLDNALKYSPPGSAIRAAVVREIHPEGAVQKVSVSNQTLPGPRPDAKRLFSKYYRGDAVQRISGSGLGLHLSRLLARRHGGNLIYQADAQGITFTLVLPEACLAAAVSA